MGFAFAVGSGKLPIEVIKEMLNNPKLPDPVPDHKVKCLDKIYPLTHYRMALPKGLYLADIVYASEDLKDSTDNVIHLPIGDPTSFPSRNIEWFVLNSDIKISLYV